MKKILSVVAATAVAFSITAAPASAETLYRNGANKVTIKPIKAPAGTVTTKARVAVKKGSKTVAKNKSFYKAKKGKYKVTSTVTYFTPSSDVWVPEVIGSSTTKVVPVLESDMAFEQCIVTGRTITNRTVQAVDYSDYWGEATVTGQAVIAYTGTCTAEIASQGYVKHSWTDEWTELEDVFEPWEDMTREEFDSFNAQAWLEGALGSNGRPLYPHPIGNVVYYPGNGSELDKAGSITVTVPGTVTPGYWNFTPAGPLTTVKSTRTVVVR